MPNPAMVNLATDITTTDGALATLMTITLADNTTAHIELRALARCASTGDSRCWFLMVCAKRMSGNTMLFEAPIEVAPTMGDMGAISWTLTFDVGGTDLLLTAKGQTGRSIDWYANADVATLTDS
jgi:hypothetical protein